MCIFGHYEFVPVFFGKIVAKFQNGHYWPFWIYTSLFGKNCQKKFGTAIPNFTILFGKSQKNFRVAIFGHSKFTPVFLGKILGKNSGWPFLAILNLYQSFWEKLSEKIWNSHFDPFWIYTRLFGKNCQKKFGMAIPNFITLSGKSQKKFRMAIFHHSKFIPVFLGKIVGKNLKRSFLAILNLYQSFWEKLLEEIQNDHFWPFWIYNSLFGKNCWKTLEWSFLAILNLYQSFWEKFLEKIQNGHFWSFWIFSDNFSVHITLMECTGLESNEICTFLDFYSEI